MRKDTNMNLRINVDQLKKFKEKSTKPYQVMLREMIKAFNEDRLRIIMAEEDKQALKIYQMEN